MPTQTGQRPEHQEISSMVATLCCYEERFGPYHPITLRLMTERGDSVATSGFVGACDP